MIGVIAVLDTESFLLGIAAGGGGGGVTVEALSVSANGTYQETGKAYSPVTVDVKNYYPPFATINLAKGEGEYEYGSTLTLDASSATTFDAALNGNYSCPGYETIVIINIPNRALRIQNFSSYHRATDGYGFKHLILDGDIKVEKTQYAFRDNQTLVDITGGALDFSDPSAQGGTLITATTGALQEIRFVAGTIGVSLGVLGPALSQASVISLANGLSSSVSAQTLTLDATIKNGLDNIVGTVTDGVFTQDAAGSVTLTDFITQTKGWTVA